MYLPSLPNNSNPLPLTFSVEPTFFPVMPTATADISYSSINFLRPKINSNQILEKIRELANNKYKILLGLKQLYPDYKNIKVNKKDIELYCLSLYNLYEKLVDEVDIQGNKILYDEDFLIKLDSCFDSFCLNQPCFALNMLRLSLDIHDEVTLKYYYENAVVIDENHQWLKNRLMDKALFNLKYNKAETTKNFFLEAASLEAQRIILDVGLKTKTKVHHRFYSNTIGTDTFVVLMISIFGGYNDNKTVVTHPGIVYLLAWLYSDLASLFLTHAGSVLNKSINNLIKLMYGDEDRALDIKLWEEKVKHLYVTTITPAAAAIALAGPAAHFELDLWLRVTESLATYSIYTTIAALAVISPLFSKKFNKRTWNLDHYAYQWGAPGVIFVAAALPTILNGISAIVDYCDGSIENNSNTYRYIWFSTAIVAMLAQQFLYLWRSTVYAKNCEKHQALNQWYIKSLYSVEKNKALVARLAENVWAIMGVLITASPFIDLRSKYPNKGWISIMAVPLVLFCGPKLSALFQREFYYGLFSGYTGVSAKVPKEYIKYLLQNKPVTLEPNFKQSLQIKINKGESLSQRIQRDELTAQNGSKGLIKNYADLTSSITIIASYLVAIDYTWNRGIKHYWLDDTDGLHEGTWSYLGMHLTVSVALVIIIRYIQILISLDDRVEKVAIEATGLPTRLLRGIKGLFTGDFWAWQKRVFVSKRTYEQKFMEQTAKDIHSMKPMLASYQPVQASVIPTRLAMTFANDMIVDGGPGSMVPA